MSNVLSLKDRADIVDLNPIELSKVDGGLLPLIPIAYFGIGLSAAVLVAGYSWLAGVEVGHANNM